MLTRIAATGTGSSCKRLGLPETRIEIDLADVGATVDEFQAIGEDPEKFVAFVNVRGELVKRGPTLKLGAA